MTPIENIKSRLKNVAPRGNGYKALCPAHDDHEQSLSVDVGSDGRVLLKCFAGCPQGEVVKALGLTLRDLFPPSNGNGQRRIVATYPYHDEGNDLLFEIVRYSPKDFRQRRPDGRGGYIWKLDGVRRVLYHLPEVLAADPAQPIFLVEGEKDADNLRTLGLVATTNPRGADRWRDEYSEFLLRRHVNILPDNDPAGAKHAAQVAQSLYGKAASVKIFRLPTLPAKGDASDWIDSQRAEGMTDKEIATRLLELSAAVPEWTPNDYSGNKAVFVSAAEFVASTPEPETLIEKVAQRGDFLLVVGRPKKGKSLLALELARAVATGTKAFGVLPCKKANVLLLLRDDKPHRIASRLRTMGLGDLPNVYLTTGAN